jgi:DNA-binding MarR family transcriptional regulator
MNEKGLETKPGHLIRRLQQIAVAIFMNETQHFNITPVQYAALFTIERNPGISQTRLVKIIALDRSTTGGLVSRLENKKWIKRVAGSYDRRTNRLTITNKGRMLLQGIDSAVDRAQELILAPLRPSERPVFMGMLERLIELNNSRSRATLEPVASSRKSNF